MSSTRISRRVNAPRAKVYRALVDADALATWMVPTGTDELDRGGPLWQWLAGKPTLIVTLILAQIVLTLLAVGWAARRPPAPPL